MRAERYIRRYNRLNGKSVSKDTLARFHAEIKKELDNKRIDASSPLGVELIGIEKRIAKALPRINGDIVTLALKPINVSKYVHAQHLASKKKKEHALDGTGCICGLEHIQNDGHLDGISDTTYQVITDKILELMKSDGLIWRKPWNEKVSGPTDLAHNHVTKHVYRGANYYLNYLLLAQFKYPQFFSFNQVEKLGGKVKKGEKGWPVVYFKWLYKDIEKGKLVPENVALDANGKLKAGYERFPGLFYYKVFNLDQTEGLTIKQPVHKPKTKKEIIESAEAIVEEMPKRPPIKPGKAAFYIPSQDRIEVPPLDQFSIDQEYYSTLFHELIHSTGHSTRVGRVFGGKFGDKKYSFEELIAELGASYLCGESGILYFTLNNSAAYIKGWTSKLKDEMAADPQFFLKAASAAQKASDFMLARGEYHDLKKLPKKSKKEKRKTFKPKSRGKKVVAMAVGETPKQKKKIRKVLHEYKEGKLKSHGKVVKKKDQALAIAMHEAKVPNKTGVLSGADIAAMNFKKLELTGPWKIDLGSLYMDEQLMFWGSPGSGKTVYILRLAKYLAQDLGLKVLYVANEELGRSSFTEKMKQFNIHAPNLNFTRDLKADVAPYDVVVLDSVNSLRMSLDGYIKFHDEHPGKMFIVVVQSTKDGDFRGGQDWEHEMDFAGELVDRALIVHKNRYDSEFNQKRDQFMIDKQVREQATKKMIRQKVKEQTEPPQPQAL